MSIISTHIINALTTAKNNPASVAPVEPVSMTFGEWVEANDLKSEQSEEPANAEHICVNKDLYKFVQLVTVFKNSDQTTQEIKVNGKWVDVATADAWLTSYKASAEYAALVAEQATYTDEDYF